MRFPKALRLLKKQQFFRAGRPRKFGRFLIVDIQPNNLSYTRLGITASKRFGNAVQRNRFKRIVREAFRHSYPQLKSGFDLNVRPRAYALEAKSTDIEEELQSLITVPFAQI